MGKPQQNNSGILFRNERREKDSHPHATGNAVIDGIEYWVSAWTKEGAKGKFQTLAFKRKTEKSKDQPQVEDLSTPF